MDEGQRMMGKSKELIMKGRQMDGWEAEGRDKANTDITHPFIDPSSSSKSIIITIIIVTIIVTYGLLLSNPVIMVG